jgi:hypothetical protein
MWETTRVTKQTKIEKEHDDIGNQNYFKYLNLQTEHD